MKTVLDTNAYSAAIRGHRAVLTHIRFSREIFVPSVVVGELLYGFRLGERFQENVARLQAFLERPGVSLAEAGYTTADRYGLVSASLRRKGRLIPVNDIWAAAHALELGADLLSSDSHFDLIDGLSWIPFSPDSEDSVRERILEHYARPPAPG